MTSVKLSTNEGYYYIDLMTYNITVIIFVLMIKTRDKCYLQYYYRCVVDLFNK